RARGAGARADDAAHRGAGGGSQTRGEGDGRGLVSNRWERLSHEHRTSPRKRGPISQSSGYGSRLARLRRLAGTTAHFVYATFTSVWRNMTFRASSSKSVLKAWRSFSALATFAAGRAL